MRILTSAAVFGLVPVPPTLGDQLGKDGNLEHFDGADPAPQDAPESTPPETRRSAPSSAGLCSGSPASSSACSRSPWSSAHGRRRCDGEPSQRAEARHLRDGGGSPPKRSAHQDGADGHVRAQHQPRQARRRRNYVIVSYTRKAASYYADIERELVALGGGGGGGGG